MAWETLVDPWADARLIRFKTSAPSGQAHRFGMAVDPDIGRNAANDRSGFDAGRQLVFATDPAMVVGFMIVDATGDTSLSVRQFGARRLAPRVREDAWNTHRLPGVQLTEGEDDVQFLIWKDAVEGTAQWTLVILRGSSVADIQRRRQTSLWSG